LSFERGRTQPRWNSSQQVTDKAIVGIDQSLSIITALLRLTEIETSRRAAGFGDVVLHEILREVCDAYQPIAEDKNIDLSVDIDRKLHVGATATCSLMPSPTSSMMPSSSPRVATRWILSSCGATAKPLCA
jgi:signal transduction histidine kinase